MRVKYRAWKVQGRKRREGRAGPTPGWVDVDLSFCSEFLTNRSRGGGCHGSGPGIRAGRWLSGHRKSNFLINTRAKASEWKVGMKEKGLLCAPL